MKRACSIKALAPKAIDYYQYYTFFSDLETSAFHLYTCLSAFMTLRKGQVINILFLIKRHWKKKKRLKILSNLESTYVNFSKLPRTDHLFFIPNTVAAERQSQVKNKKVEPPYQGIFVNYLTQLCSNYICTILLAHQMRK